jgi:hypothetical protein
MILNYLYFSNDLYLSRIQSMPSTNKLLSVVSFLAAIILMSLILSVVNPNTI